MVAAITSSAGAADAEKIVATAAGTGVLDDTLMGAAETGASVVVKSKSDGTLDLSLMPSGIGPDTASIVTSENLAAGNLVNIYDNAGTVTARKADATAEGKECHGFVLAGTTSPAAALVYFEGKLTGLTGLTPGARQFVATSPGTTTETAPTGAGNVAQCVGIAISTTAISFEAQDPVTVA
jgi:hypothetical protein